MSAGSPSRHNARKARPYEPPSLTQLTPQSAQLALQANTKPGDRQAARLLRALQETTPPVYNRVNARDVHRPKVSGGRWAAFLAVVAALCAEPLLLLVAVVAGGSAVGKAVHQLPVFWLPMWAVFALWVTLDNSRFYSLIGERPDPLEAKGLKLSAWDWLTWWVSCFCS